MSFPSRCVAQAITTAADGLTCQAEWWSVGTAIGGYVPVRIQLTNMLPKERLLRVAIESPHHPGASEVFHSLELEAAKPGAPSQVELSLSVPVTGPYLNGQLKVYERGREIRKLRMFGIIGGGWSSELLPTTVLIARTTPDLRNIRDAMSRLVGGNVQRGNMQPMTLPLERAPLKWIDYSTVDLLLISVADLESLSDGSRDALIAWTLAGGNLFVFGLGEDRENAPELKRLLDIDRRGPRGASWRLPDVSERSLQQFENAGQYAGTPTGQRVRLSRASSDTAAATPAPEPAVQGKAVPYFSIRPFGLGQLVACSPADPFPGTLEDWAWVARSVGAERVQWQMRHGVSPRGENDDFWNFLIPGVGKAPVGGFQVLITLFAIVIGPVNYLILRQRKQLYLLIVTVPLFAAATATMLFGYALASDGFTLRGRVRSVTLLDQVHGESVNWARVSFYAGVAPSGGLRFSNDTAVFPIEPSGSPGSNRVLDWTHGQHMASGWLRARTPTQLLTVTYRQGTEHVAIATSSVGVVRATNQLGARIRMVALAGEDGGYYWARDLERDASVVLQRVEPDELLATIRAALDAQRLELPVDMDGRELSLTYSRGRRWFWSNSPTPEWRTNLIETVLRSLQAPGDAALKSIMQSQTYLAITEQPPMVDLGVTQWQDEGSLFVVVGMY